MDNEQAKVILGAYRPGGEDGSDPFFAEALDHVRHDPELGAWFAEQRRFDRSVHAALQTETPPPGLRESILLDGKTLRLKETAPRGRLRAKPALWLALAASVALLFGIAFVLRPGAPSPMSGEQFVQSAIELKTGGHISLAKMSSDPEDLRAWLARHRSPSRFALPSPLAKLRPMGCQTYTLHGHKVSLVCFVLDKDRIVHFFIIDTDRLKGPPGTRPQFRKVDDIATATWSSGGRTFVLVGKDVDEETLARLI